VRAQRPQEDRRLDDLDRQHSAVDRIWAGENRDAAAGDRAALRDLATNYPEDPQADS
jgi:hypothetical protein